MLDPTDPSTIDVDVVIANINHDFAMRGERWTTDMLWPNVTVKALADEIERLRKQVEEMRPWYPPTHEQTRPVTVWSGQSWAPPEDLIDQGADDA